MLAATHYPRVSLCWGYATGVQAYVIRARSRCDALGQEQIVVHESARVLKYRDGSDRPYEELFAGDDLSVDGTWAHKRSLFAFEADLRVETVIDATGQILHHIAHGLSDHEGHGSNKPALREARAIQKRLRSKERAALKAERDALYRAGELPAYLAGRRLTSKG